MAANSRGRIATTCKATVPAALPCRTACPPLLLTDNPAIVVTASCLAAAPQQTASGTVADTTCELHLPLGTPRGRLAGRAPAMAAANPTAATSWASGWSCRSIAWARAPCCMTCAATNSVSMACLICGTPDGARLSTSTAAVAGRQRCSSTWAMACCTAGSAATAAWCLDQVLLFSTESSRTR